MSEHNQGNKSNKQKGGSDTIYDFSDIEKFKIPSMNNYNDKYSFINSLHKILVSHGILPKTMNVIDFAKDMKIKKIIEDIDITNDYINDISTKIKIDHELDMKNGKSIKKNVINGVNIFIVERDCNNFYDVSCTSHTSNTDNDENKICIIMMKEGDLYKPVMRIDENNGNGKSNNKKIVKGLYNINDPMIIHLLEESEKL
jgi:hypothetical protein